MISSLRLVKFSDRRWGVRSGWIFHSYYSTVGYWWGKDNLLAFCMMSESQAREAFKMLQGGEVQDAPKYVSITISNSDIGFWFVAGCVVLAIAKYLP